MALHIGDRIPEELGTDQHGEPVKASHYAGKKLAIYFYPKDNTPGCTAQACSLRDGYSDLQQAGYAVLGVSVDSATSQQKFINKHTLPFPLIADTENVGATFGVWQEKTMMGKRYMGTVRTTFLTDEQGVITHVLAGREVDTKNHAVQILGSK